MSRPRPGAGAAGSGGGPTRAFEGRPSDLLADAAEAGHATSGYRTHGAGSGAHAAATAMYVPHDTHAAHRAAWARRGRAARVQCEAEIWEPFLRTPHQRALTWFAHASQVRPPSPPRAGGEAADDPTGSALHVHGPAGDGGWVCRGQCDGRTPVRGGVTDACACPPGRPHAPNRHDGARRRRWARRGVGGARGAPALRGRCVWARHAQSATTDADVAPADPPVTAPCLTSRARACHSEPADSVVDTDVHAAQQAGRAVGGSAAHAAHDHQRLPLPVLPTREALSQLRPVLRRHRPGLQECVPPGHHRDPWCRPLPHPLPSL